ncbi:MAG: GNAT family N-acetyltransferase [Pseudomonadota bacterium]
MSITIKRANLDAPEFAALIGAHAELMLSLSPPGSCHFLPVEGLRTPDVTVWDMREGETLVGCGALKELTPSHGEVKSMHTVRERRGGGLGRQMLEHILSEARARGYQRLSLETGSMDGFKPARTLYEVYGFSYCPPFGDYTEDPNSVFMTLRL